ncbi:MAG: hypothetical protein KF718_25415 [Polyangiaceae bacterium]|nr:hypothetical protein [Polyangiaceae bacterium]
MAGFRGLPLFAQIFGRKDGTGTEAMSPRTRQLSARTTGSQTTRSVCPYCAVGCGQLVHHRDGELVAIEGDPESPINQGTLCPKGAASLELLTHPARLTQVLYRAPHTRAWEVVSTSWAMDRIAQLVWESRARTFVKEVAGERVGHSSAVAHLGGATLDDEENYLLKKLFTAGLGLVSVSNQARI